jgi:nucleotide-binding universal stress UspA family protein
MKIQKILIAVDDSINSAHAAEYGFDIARKINAEVALVNIVEPMMMPPITSSDPIMGVSPLGSGFQEMEILDIQKSQSETILERTIKKFAADLEVKQFNEYGPTADGIITCSKEFDADLIIVGTHGRTGLDRFLKGSVAEHVVRHSEVPVLVVPFREESS